MYDLTPEFFAKKFKTTFDPETFKIVCEIYKFAYEDACSDVGQDIPNDLWKDNPPCATV